MAQKTIKLPNGETVTVNVPDGATDEQILRFVKREYEAGRIGQGTQTTQPEPQPQQQATQPEQQQVEQKPEDNRPIGQRFAEQRLGNMENFLSFASGAVGEVAGGWAGLLSMPFTGAKEAADIVRSVSSAMTYQPRTEQGKKQQKIISEALSPVAEWLVEKPGDAAFALAQTPEFRAAASATGNPILLQMAQDPSLAGAMGAAGPTALLEVMGLKGLSQAKNAKQARKVIADEITSGERNVDNILKAVDQSGNLTKNMRAKEVVRLFDDEIAGKKAAITFEALDNADRRATSQMLDIIEKSRKLPRSYLMENRPADVIGAGVAQRIKQVKQLRKKAGDDIEAALPRLRRQKIDINSEGVALVEQLQSIGVDITRGKGGKYRINLENSPVTLGDGIKKGDIERLLNLLDEPTKNGAAVHGIKQFAQKIVNYDQRLVSRTASPEVENVIKNVAAQLNGKLRALDKGYAAANDVYSSSAEAMGLAQKFLKNIDLEKPIADKRLGATAKRIATNFTSRDEVMMMIDDLEGVLRANKVPIAGDIKRQVAVLAELEDIFKLEKQQSPFGLSGRVETAVQAATDPTTATIRGLDKAIDSVRSWRTPDFDERIRILRQTVREDKQ